MLITNSRKMVHKRNNELLYSKHEYSEVAHGICINVCICKFATKL